MALEKDFLNLQRVDTEKRDENQVKGTKLYLNKTLKKISPIPKEKVSIKAQEYKEHQIEWNRKEIPQDT